MKESNIQLIDKFLKKCFFQEHPLRLWNSKYFAGCGRNGHAKFIFPNNIVVLRPNETIKRFMLQTHNSPSDEEIYHYVTLEIFSSEWIVEIQYVYSPAMITTDYDVLDSLIPHIPTIIFLGDEHKFRNDVMLAILYI
jgi:hypothetical protein